MPKTKIVSTSIGRLVALLDEISDDPGIVADYDEIPLDYTLEDLTRDLGVIRSVATRNFALSVRVPSDE